MHFHFRIMISQQIRINTGIKRLKYSDCRHLHGGNKVHLIDLTQLITAGDQNNSNSHLRGLTAATCILKLLSKGYSKEQIIYGKFNGDIQIVSLWIDFLKDKNWIEEREDSVDGTDFKVTKKGKTWLNRFESADIKVKN